MLSVISLLNIKAQTTDDTNYISAPGVFVVSTSALSLNVTNGKNFKSVFRIFTANQPDDGLLMVHSPKLTNIVMVTMGSRADTYFTNSKVFKGQQEDINVFTKEKIGTNDVSFTAVKPKKR